MVKLIRTLLRSTVAVWVFVFACAAAGEGQTVSNIRVYRIDSGRIAVWYDLAPPGAEEIGLEALSDGGAQFTIRPRSLSGDVGRGVAPGFQRRILWDAARDGVALTDSTVVRITGVGPASVETGGQGTLSPEVHETPSIGVVTAVLTDSVIRLDGFLDEEAWKTAVPVSDFTQQELREGEVPTERTEVRILCDRDRLYIGVVCHDRDPGRIISRALTWDGALENDDMFAVVLDTYRDRRAGFWFAVNPNGARADATFRSGDKNNRNAQWDGIWETSARIGPEGWTCEIAIPFKTLRFPATGTQEWGLNFHRVIPGFMIQGGDPLAAGMGGPGYTIVDEFDSTLKHSAGAISMANAGPGTGGSQFFVVQVPQNHLDGKHSVFGMLREGWDVSCIVEAGDKIDSVRIQTFAKKK